MKLRIRSEQLYNKQYWIRELKLRIIVFNNYITNKLRIRSEQLYNKQYLIRELKLRIITRYNNFLTNSILLES